MHYLHVNDLFHSDWVKAVHDTLNTFGLSDIWLSHDTFYSQAAFKNKVKTWIADQFKQAWKSNIDESENVKIIDCRKKIFALRNISTFSHCHYLNIHVYVNLDAVVINYPLRKGRFLNIERNERICQLCNKNELRDEFHYLLNCDYFNRSRLKFLPLWSFQSPYTVKFEKLLISDDRTVLTK